MIRITEAIIAAILSRREIASGKGPERWLVDELNRIADIQDRIDAAKAEIRKAEDQHRTAIAAQETAIAMLQSECPHYARRYHGDPAGGTDSHHSCDHCGARW